MRPAKITYSLQSIRILASFIVMLYHITYIFEDKLGIFFYRSFFNFGKSGVHLFFVLSGYVMYMVHKDDIGKGIRPGRKFAWKRFIRIYPTYWVLTTLAVIAMLFFSGQVKDYKYNFFYIFQSYSLLELGLMKGLPIITPAWSLFHEIKFYIFFLLLIVIKNKNIRTLLIVAMAIATLATTINVRWLGSNVYSSFYFSSLNLLFVLGVLSAWVTTHYFKVFKSKLYIVLGVGSFVMLSVLCNVFLWVDTAVTDLLFGLSAFAVITSFTCREMYCSAYQHRNPFKINSKGLLMADVSYCLYLIHIPVYLIIFNLNRRIGLPQPVFILTMLVSATAAAIVYYKLIEYPLITVIKKVFTRHDPHPAVVARPQLNASS